MHYIKRFADDERTHQNILGNTFNLVGRDLLTSQTQ